MTKIGCVMDYLKLVAKLQQGRPSVAQFLLDHGKSYKVNAKTFEGRRGKAGHCYMNATRQALETGRTYVEGYMTFLGIPIEHAWTMDNSGQVYDPTIKPHPNEKIGSYYGVAFNRAYLFEAMQINGYYGVLGEWSKTRMDLATGKTTNFKVG